jgi:predicted TIM-barrel fold metal-dependent hydrolase
MTDPKLRLADMDSEKIDIAVLFGAGLAGTIPALDDAGLAIELARARNTWLAQEYCAENSRRIKGTAALAQQDIDASVEELRRSVKELGFVGASLLPNVKGRHLGDAYYFPLYAEANASMCRFACTCSWAATAPMPWAPSAWTSFSIPIFSATPSSR